MGDVQRNMSVNFPTDSGSFTDSQDENTVLLRGTKKKEIVKGSTWYGSVVLVINAALGAGLLEFPQAYHEAGGVVAAISMQSVFMIFIVGAMFILAYSSDIKKTNNYQDVVSSVCGRKGRIACAITISLYCYGTCITFLTIIGDQWEEFFLFVDKSFYCNDSPFYLSRIFVVTVTSILFILPLSFPKRIDFLKYASGIGFIGILYVVFLVTVKFILPFPTPQGIRTSPNRILDTFLVVPSVCFAYQCHVSLIPIYSCFEKRNLREFSKTISVAVTLLVLTYTVVAAFGYLMFGEAITSDILLSFDPSPDVIVAVIFIAVKTYTTYPILLFCGRAGVDCLWTEARGLSPEAVESGERQRRITITLIWFATSLALGVFVPNIGVVIQVLGAFAAVFIFIFPGLCLMHIVLPEQGVKWSRRTWFLVIFSCTFMTLGGFIFGLTLTQALMQDMSGGVKADKSAYTCD